MTSTPTATMQAWQSPGVTTTLEASLALNPAAPAPTPQDLRPNELLLEVLAAGLNPADYKPAELGLLSKLAFRGPPYVPGMDFAARVVAAHPSVADAALAERGALVFGALSNQPRPRFGGTLGRYVVVPATHCARVPAGVRADKAAGAGVAGLSALGAMAGGAVREGSKVFVNGGSGGVGTFAIQMAKALGAAHVTATCSAGNVELCRGLGADEVLDYRSVDVVEELKSGGRVFDIVVDNVGDPAQKLYESAGSFLKEGGSYVQIGAGMSFAGARSIASRVLLPKFLGGGERKFRVFLLKVEAENLKRIGEWMKEGKVKTVIDQTFEFDEVPKAFEKLRQGRTRGKIVVHVGK